jgi:hypothetical protein
MVTVNACIRKYGLPKNGMPCLTVWDIPTELEIGFIPKKLYCNKDIIEPLSKAFKALIDTGKVDELKTWDGCFNIRMMRGIPNSYSLHSWGIAIDVNAFENQLNVPPKLSPEFVKCFKDNGFDWGGEWQRTDGMHFQLAAI